jgi:dihydrofolate synthase / folylpolyglutamate synthase
MDIEAQYQATLEYLYTFVDYSLTHNLSNLPEKWDLDRMRDFLKPLGNPHQAYPVIHVAGTKGKGSVCAMCASALRAAGYKVGLYTSPHMQDYAERIQLDGRPIPHADLVDLVDELRPALDQSKRLTTFEITTFEITTALAFLYFAQQGATAVVAEVGLGGRLDATNVVHPLVSVITSISYDHTQVLGNTLEEIAAEKGGIIKPGVPLVISPQKEAARLVFERMAAERGAPLLEVGREFQFSPIMTSLERQSLAVWRVQGETAGEPVKLTIPLLGAHQLENAATAYAALEVAQEGGLKLTKSAIQHGFAAVDWPGRFEVLRSDPPLVIDSAHNRDSALRLRQTLETYFPGQRAVLIFGASEDKDISGMLEELSPVISRVIFTRSYHPRAIQPEKLLELVAPYNLPAQVAPAVEEALSEALRLAGGEGLVLATGSLFVAAGVRHSWYNQQGITE